MLPSAEAPIMRRVVFFFHGTFETQGGVVFAKCDHAPLVAHGVDQDQALERMDKVMAAYVSELARRGEIEAAILAGKLKADLSSIPADGPTFSTNKENGTFTAELAGVA